MIPVVVTAERPRRWWRLRSVRTWRRWLPEKWSDMPEPRRRLYYALALAGREQEVLRHCLRLPAWAWQAMRAEEVAAMAGALAWMRLDADCEHVPFPSFTHQGVTYHFPKPKGENMSCIEYAIADEYYMQLVRDGDESALLLLSATLYRQETSEHGRAIREDDARVPLHSRAEIVERANWLRRAPLEYQTAALLFFAGLKKYVRNVYGPHLFDLDDEEQDDPEAEQPESQPEPNDNEDDGFGWWGIFQDVAEAGLFGTMKEVYQASFHEVCMWLVRQRIRERKIQAMYATKKPSQHID